jgi:hypothetical protein
MKFAVAVPAVLLLVSTMVVGQQSPFPQNANPALIHGEDTDTSRAVAYQRHNVDLPPSMAANQGGTTGEIAPAEIGWRDEVNIGSPFPMNANPSPTSSTTLETPERLEDTPVSSPFPSAALGMNW